MRGGRPDMPERRHKRMQRLRKSLQLSVALLALGAAPALAQDQIKVGIGYGLAFLPIYVCEDLKLVEKHAKEAHLDAKAEFQRFASAAEAQAALASGEINIAPFGTAPLLAAWAKGKDRPEQVFAVSGLTSLPLTLLSNQPDVASLGDIKSSDQIAMPTLTSPQMYVLELQSEKAFKRYDQLKSQVVALPHADAINDLVEGSGQVRAYFASPPYAELALRDAKVHAVLNSPDVMGGKFSFLILGATKAYLDAAPQVPDVIERAMDEAARIIHDDPRRAAQIYLTHEPSDVMSGPAMEAVIRDIKGEFGSPIYGVKAVADFMGRHGELATVPQSFKDVAAPALANTASN
jgi:ABC-type nitrate/sulfonate/bicarbonate transport system substrate-binding protein